MANTVITNRGTSLANHLYLQQCDNSHVEMMFRRIFVQDPGFPGLAHNCLRIAGYMRLSIPTPNAKCMVHALHGT
jgi:hypothetical protein